MGEISVCHYEPESKRHSVELKKKKGKKKVPGTAVSKEIHVDRLLKHDRTYLFQVIFWKNSNCK